MMLRVEIDSYSYSEKTILENLHFKLQAGEHLSVLGESGCGKSTLLHLIYGLLQLEKGAIFYNEKKLLGPANSLIPGEPFMKLVAQEFNIMPFTTVAENLGSHLSRLDEATDEKRIDQLLEAVEMEDFKNVLVKNLSGGQKQRVALAKALANEPKILLLDEPFSNIDVFRKNKLQRKIYSYLKEKNIGCITATHDSNEALAFSDQILMLKNGREEMMGTPEYIYKNVATEYQAGFFGEANLLPQSLESKEVSGGKTIVFPHQLSISTEKTNFEIIIKNSFFKGSHYLIEADFNGETVFFTNLLPIKKGEVHCLKISDNA
ncbi:ABC transporter ATP-binding protein [Aequorivita sp. SDUM287046]|uniref:ABC transporter ATP-binding protein n=1 Tax=Aequorivita aurantiaca TaxID=3053356 RepID=A0ABT8DIK8_9FLAO|nr:ABC transporter ATP-binding protein [Aequorivita aurantiaca]MDN3723038.1 ABC transporter ATP-binding protein [Aequorivita aurantiaca]